MALDSDGTTPTPAPKALTFEQRVWEIVRAVPRGRVITYGRIAQALGGPHLARTVGYAMARCPEGVPWHRVVNAQGRVSQRRWVEGMLLQRALLEAEGIEFDDEESLDLARYEHETPRCRGRRRQWRTGRR